MPSAVISSSSLLPEVLHPLLGTTFYGIEHAVSTPEAPVHQYRGIKYASVPARFRQSRLHVSYPRLTDATKYGPICPQVKYAKTVEEELFGLSEAEIPKQLHPTKQNEFECLNLNITCPAGLAADAKLPVLVWVHGGGDRGSGSNWIHDAGPLVQKSLTFGKPVIVVNFNFRLGLLGFAASPLIREDNKAAGEEGVGNYGLRDQRKALEWVHSFIAGFGGDPFNVTLFGESTGAADIVSHRLSAANETYPLFHRAIIQSAIVDENPPTVSAAGWHLSRVMAALRTSTVAQLRSVDADVLVTLGMPVRAVDDGVFFRSDWRHFMGPDHRPQSTSAPLAVLQPMIIGDCSADSLLWSLPASLWTPYGASKRIAAVCQSIQKSTEIMRAYEISPSTPDEDITEHLLDLINDARIAWPTERIARAARRLAGGHGVWRYVFDQEGSTRGLSHHAADLGYLFDNIPLPESSSTDVYFDGSFSDDDDDDSMETTPVGTYDDQWDITPVDSWSYARVKNAMQESWLSFASGEAPWDQNKVFVFGPEGEIGERSDAIFKGRRRIGLWKGALDPLGIHLVQKVALELSRGPY